jgi:hypothetical protein
MLLFSFVFVFLNAETEIVFQIPSAGILLILLSGEGPHFPWTRNHQMRIRHYVGVGHQSIILAHTVVERPMNNRSLNFRLYERVRTVHFFF